MHALIRSSAIVASLALLTGWLASGSPRTSAADEPKKTPVQLFMEAKLTDSQDILEGLVTEDFDLIQKGAEHLQAMSKATEWHVIQGPVFAQHSNEFRRTAEKLAAVAKQKNIDGAALTYMHLTMTCIDCHKFVRSTRIAAAPAQDLPAIDRALLAQQAALTAAAAGR